MLRQTSLPLRPLRPPDPTDLQTSLTPCIYFISKEKKKRGRGSVGFGVGGLTELSMKNKKRPSSQRVWRPQTSPTSHASPSEVRLCCSPSPYTYFYFLYQKYRRPGTPSTPSTPSGESTAAGEPSVSSESSSSLVGMVAADGVDVCRRPCALLRRPRWHVIHLQG